jgi:hypothetical protein
MIYGEGGSGKTFWALDLAFHVHNGAQWRDKDVAKGAVFYIASEAGRGIKKRIAGVRKLHPDWHAPFVADMAPNLSDAASIASIRDAIGETQCAMLVIDTMSAAFEGDDSSQKDTALMMRNLVALASGLECLVVFVHHTTKDGASWRGSGVLKYDADGVIEITSEGDDEHHMHVARMVKVREGEQGARYGFRLRKTEPLATKPNGKFVTTLVIEQVEHAEGEATPPKPMTEELKKLQPVYTELSLEGPVKWGALLAAAKTKGIKVHKFDAARDYTRHYNRAKPGEGDVVWF